MTWWFFGHRRRLFWEWNTFSSFPVGGDQSITRQGIYDFFFSLSLTLSDKIFFQVTSNWTLGKCSRPMNRLIVLFNLMIVPPTSVAVVFFTSRMAADVSGKLSKCFPKKIFLSFCCCCCWCSRGHLPSGAIPMNRTSTSSICNEYN